MNVASKSVLLGTIMCGSVQAEHCNVNFNYGVIIDPAHIRIIKESQTQVQINGKHQLFINGREIQLAKEQQAILAQYASSIRQQVPEIVSIAIEGVEIGLKSVNKVIGSLTGENSASHQNFQEKFEEMKWRVRRRFNHTDQNYYLGPQDFDDFGDIFAGQFEAEIEEIVSQSIGSILAAVGDAMTNSNEESAEQRPSTFDEKIKTMGKDLKLEIGGPAASLKYKADLFCQNLVLLDELETQLHQEIPPLAGLDLIETGHDDH